MKEEEIKSVAEKAIYTSLYCQLLSELLHILRIQLLQQHPQKEADF